MYTPYEIKTIIKSCNKWSELCNTCKIFDWLIQNDFIQKNGVEERNIRTEAFLQVNILENFDEEIGRAHV